MGDRLLTENHKSNFPRRNYKPIDITIKGTAYPWED